MFGLKLFKSTGFKLKIVPSWYSENYVHFKYTKNGRSWNYIHEASYPSLDGEEWTFPRLSRLLLDGHFYNEKEKFNSLEKIKMFEKEELEKVKRENFKIEKNKLEKKARIKMALEKANEGIN